MTAPAAIAGHFADIRTIKTRSAIQMIIEVPIEQGADIIAMFGFPQPADPVAVAVARINLSKEVVPHNVAPRPHGNKTWASDGKRQWSELSLAQQAGIRCSEQAFQKFLSEVEGVTVIDGGDFISSADEAAVYVRLICGVKSRADLDKTLAARAKWQDLDVRYQVWLRDEDGEAR